MQKERVLAASVLELRETAREKAEALETPPGEVRRASNGPTRAWAR